MVTTTMTQTFTIFFEGPELTDEFLDAAYEAGCGDAVFGSQAGQLFAEFDREDHDLAKAVASAIVDLAKADHLVRITGLEVGNPISPSTIADRIGLTREAVRLLSKGERGPGGFPSPVQFVSNRPLYSWAESHMWLDQAGYQCKTNWDIDSERALETLSAVMTLDRLTRAWTPESQDHLEALTAALATAEEETSELADILVERLGASTKR
jgi:hypothetical protein